MNRFKAAILGLTLAAGFAGPVLADSWSEAEAAYVRGDYEEKGSEEKGSEPFLC